MNEIQLKLFNNLSKSRLKDYDTFKKEDYRGIWNSIINKYPESAHFIYELIQNADDAEATVAKFELYKDKLIFRHNGRKHFDVTEEGVKPSGDINSITGIGYSFKTEQTNKIGKFGVGFKAVFQYTDTPEIYDDDFKFKIENYIIPVLLDNDYPGRRRTETLFVFPFKNKANSFNVIIERLQTLKNPVLFLNHLEKITYRYESANGLSDEVVYGKELDEKKIFDGMIVEKCKLLEPSNHNSIFLFSEEAIISGVKNQYVSVGFYYDEEKKKLITESTQNIYCFFPTLESFNSCFVSHAPFLLTDNRQNLLPNETVNVDLVNQIAQLATKAVLYLRDYGKERGLKLIDENILDIFPVYKERSYWEKRNIFEEAMKDAFLPFMKSECIFLSRNGVYLSLKSSWVVTPLELQQLLSKEQLNELVGDSSGHSDFLKWELAQEIGKYKSYIIIQSLNSSLFAKK